MRARFGSGRFLCGIAVLVGFGWIAAARPASGQG